MTLLLTEQDVRALLDMPAALEAVEGSFRHQGAGDAWLQPRRRLGMPDHALLNYMVAADRKGGWMGAKLYSIARGRARFVVMLYRADSGQLAAIIEADFLGQLRTGAASGVATKYLARADARTAGIIGTGLQARTQLEAISHVRRLERILAFGRDAERRSRFCREMSERLHVEVVPAGSAEEAVRDADIVITATTALRAVVSGAWLSKGTHVNAIGANYAQKRELDADAVNRAEVIAVDSLEQAQIESGDLIQAFGDDSSRWTGVCEVADILSGKAPGRERADQITLFKSHGIATWDIAAAARVFQRAEQQGIGQRVPFGDPRP